MNFFFQKSYKFVLKKMRKLIKKYKFERKQKIDLNKKEGNRINLLKEKARIFFFKKERTLIKNNKMIKSQKIC